MFEENELNTGSIYDLMKAMSAGQQTGRDLDRIETSGSSLKVESLDPTLKILTNRDKHIVFWKQIPKQKAMNTVEEFNQLVDYGLDVGIFNGEGVTPQFTDSIYERNHVMIKYMGVSGEVTHPFTLVKLGSGVSNALATAVYNKTQFLIRAIDKALWNSNSKNISNEFNGISAQHFGGVTGYESVTPDSLDKYWGDSTVVDARGSYLKDHHIEAAAHAAINDNFGMVSKVIAPPVVFSDYVNQFHESKRVNVGQPGSVTGAVMGQSVNTIQTQFGPVGVDNDIFFDFKKAKKYNAAATSEKSPDAVTVDGTTPIAVVTDTKTLFGTDYAGTYFYGVTAKNAYGESSMKLFATAGQAVTATQAVDLKFANTDGSYPAESFVIYRTEANPADYTVADFFPILTVSKAELSAGYDGAAVGLVRDRNREIPNTYSAWLWEPSIDLVAFKQLAPIMRMDLARISPSYRFMVLAYGAPVLYTPKKSAVIKNIGKRGLTF